MPATPRLSHLLEQSLYVSDLDRSERFYRDLLGLEPFLADDRMRGLGVPGGSVLLLFLRGASTEPSPTDTGALIPPHDAHGHQHLCFAVPWGELAAWDAHLAAAGLELESRVTWPRGGTSLYLRDPDGHSLELATPGLWPSW